MAEQTQQLTSEPAFRALADYHEKNGKQINIRQLFKQDSNRFQNYRFVFIGIPKQRMVYVLTFGQHLQGPRALLVLRDIRITLYLLLIYRVEQLVTSTIWFTFQNKNTW